MCSDLKHYSRQKFFKTALDYKQEDEDALTGISPWSANDSCNVSMMLILKRKSQVEKIPKVSQGKKVELIPFSPAFQ